jgi:hypothetical protein
MRKGSVEEFPMRDQYTVSGLVVGGICWECECRVVEIGGEDRLTLAWCDCSLPEDHFEMAVLS